MKNQVLSIKQMKHLKELGVDTIKASMCWIVNRGTHEKEIGYPIPNSSKVYCRFASKVNYIERTFTLQDMLEIMPELYPTHETESGLDTVRHPDTGATYTPTIYKYDGELVCSYLSSEGDEINVFSNNSDIILSAYNMLCWLAENGYLKQQP